MLVSVIIPVYNAEEYLSKTIDSVLSQTYGDIELILVDDGSKDSSLDICKRYQEEDQRVRVIHQKNRGTQFARELGQKEARGAYIKTMDNDDILLESAIELLLRRAEESNADMVIAPFYKVYSDGRSVLHDEYKFDKLSGTEFLKLLFTRKAYWPVWTSLHSAKLYEKNDIKTDPEILATEDTILMTQLALFSDTVAYIDKPTVNFMIREDSLSHVRRICDERLRDVRKFQAWIKQFLIENKALNEVEYEFSLLEARLAFECLAKKRFDYFMQDMELCDVVLKRYPTLIEFFYPIERKILSEWRTNKIWGYLYARWKSFREHI